MAEDMTATFPAARNTPPPRPPPPKFTSKTTEDLTATKPAHPRTRKYHSVHGKAKMEKVVQQRKMSSQGEVEKKVSAQVVPNGSKRTNQVEEVDHPVVVKSRSPTQNGGKTFPVETVGSSSGNTMTAKNLVEPVQPAVTEQQGMQSSTINSSSVTALPDLSHSKAPAGKRYRSVSANDDMALLTNPSAAAELTLTKPRSKTLPRHINTKEHSADMMVDQGRRKPSKKAPPPPIPSRPAVVMQYQNMSPPQFGSSVSSSISSHSSTPSIPENDVTPPLSPRVTPPSPDLCTPETKQQVQKANSPNQHDSVFYSASSSKPSPSSHKGRKLLSSLKSTFRKRPKSAPDDRQLNYNVESNTEHVAVSHRRAKSVKERLEEEAEASPPGGVIPPIVVQCVAYLNRPIGLNEEGLFRIPGDMSQIRKLRERFIAGKEVDLSEVLEPHNVAGLLKLHYREMRICLIPRGEMSGEITRAAKARDVEGVRKVLSQIPAENLALIRVIVELMKQVSDNSSKNQMTSGNLGASCGLSIFPSLQAGNASALLKCLVDYIDTVFPS